MVGPFSLIGRQHRHDHISELTREFVFDQRGSHRQRTVVEEPPFAARSQLRHKRIGETDGLAAAANRRGKTPKRRQRITDTQARIVCLRSRGIER